MSQPSRPPIGTIFLTVFITMIGFGIVIPVLPVYAKSPPFWLTPTQIGWLVGVFSLVQLVSAPLFGRLSDRIGRKPVLVVSIAGTALGFLVLGAAHSVWMLFLGRIIDGASGGNIATAQACLADVTTPEKRARAMGLLGAAFGLGFILGPALGGVLGHYSPALPFYVAGALSLLNLGYVLLALPETLTVEKRLHPEEPAPIGEVFADGRGPFLGWLLAATLLSTVGFAFIHVLFALFCGDHFNWSARETGYTFAYVGVLAALLQGGLLRRLLARNLERELALTGAVLLAGALWILPRVHTPAGFLADCALLAVGNSLLTPTLSGMSSRHVHGRVQGRVLGLMAAVGSLGRFLGPALAVRPLPGNFSELPRPLTDPALFARVNDGYLQAFSWSAGFVLLSALCLLRLRVPHDIPEEPTVLPEASA